MGNVRIVYNHLPKLGRELPPKCNQTVQKAALKCETYAKDVCPVDTGALRNSIEAHSVDANTWEIAPHTEYAIYVEFGTRKMAARPYMRPAAEKIRKEYPDLVVDAIVSVVKGGGAWFEANAPDVTVNERVDE